MQRRMEMIVHVIGPRLERNGIVIEAETVHGRIALLFSRTTASEVENWLSTTLWSGGCIGEAATAKGRSKRRLTKSARRDTKSTNGSASVRSGSVA